VRRNRVSTPINVTLNPPARTNIELKPDSRDFCRVREQKRAEASRSEERAAKSIERLIYRLHPGTPFSQIRELINDTEIETDIYARSRSSPSDGPLDIFPEDKAIRMNRMENRIRRGIDQASGTMYAGRDLAKTCRALTGLAGNKRVNEKRKGRNERKRERERGKGNAAKRTLDRAIINPDVLSCQNGVNGADMTQMESRTL